MAFFKKLFNGPANQKSMVTSEVSVQENVSFSDGEFRVIDIFQIKGIGVISLGEVITGQLTPGMKTSLNGKEVEIKIIEMNHKKLSFAKQGDKVGMSLKNASEKDLQKGQVIKFVSAQKFNAAKGLSSLFG